MKYEQKITTTQYGSKIIKGTDISIITILRMLEEGKTIDEIITAQPSLTSADISACLEYATELVIISDFKKSTKKINEHFTNRHILANKLRAAANKLRSETESETENL
ncbi:MAG: DUF433 domain-containing protein [Bacteroidetes bacterium]|nr:DUF433 domain-containing protein [Bacteroidota bacterium]